MSYEQTQEEERAQVLKTMTLPDFLTKEQIKRASACKSAKAICELIIKPNMVEINRKLGQENDPMFLSYACEHVFRQAGVWKGD